MTDCPCPEVPVPGVPAFLLVGATATGKTAVAEWIACRCGCDILAADSMTLYRGMDIGTAKPDPATRRELSYLGLDLALPGEVFSVGSWLDAVRGQLAERAYVGEPPVPGGVGRRLIVCGGTGLYVKALLQGLQPSVAADPAARARWEALHAAGGVAALGEALQRISPAAYDAVADKLNPRRLIRALELAEAGQPPPTSWKSARAQPAIAGLRADVATLRRRIEARVRAMFAAGLVEEVRRLLVEYPQWSQTARQAIGYAEALACLEGRMSPAAAVEQTVRRTVQLAKRQRTWFTRQVNVRWIDVGESTDAGALGEKVLECWRECGPAVVAG